MCSCSSREKLKSFKCQMLINCMLLNCMSYTLHVLMRLSEVQVKVKKITENTPCNDR